MGRTPARVWFLRNVAAVISLLLFAALVCLAGYLATDIVPQASARARDAAWWKEQIGWRGSDHAREQALTRWTGFVSWFRGRAYPATREFVRDDVYPFVKQAAEKTEAAWKKAEEESP